MKKKILLIQPRFPETFWKMTGWLEVTGARRDRRFFLALVRIALRKGWPALHLVYETLVFFISQQKFVQSLQRRRTLSLHARGRSAESEPAPVFRAG